MFHTTMHKGHYIHFAIDDKGERYTVQHAKTGARVVCRTYRGAQRYITRNWNVR